MNDAACMLKNQPLSVCSPSADMCMGAACISDVYRSEMAGLSWWYCWYNLHGEINPVPDVVPEGMSINCDRAELRTVADRGSILNTIVGTGKSMYGERTVAAECTSSLARYYMACTNYPGVTDDRKAPAGYLFTPRRH